jgi:hypothetical protein
LSKLRPVGKRNLHESTQKNHVKDRKDIPDLQGRKACANFDALCPVKPPIQTAYARGIRGSRGFSPSTSTGIFATRGPNSSGRSIVRLMAARSTCYICRISTSSTARPCSSNALRYPEGCARRRAGGRIVRIGVGSIVFLATLQFGERLVAKDAIQRTVSFRASERRKTPGASREISPFCRETRTESRRFLDFVLLAFLGALRSE